MAMDAYAGLRRSPLQGSRLSIPREHRGRGGSLLYGDQVEVLSWSRNFSSRSPRNAETATQRTHAPLEIETIGHTDGQQHAARDDVLRERIDP